MFIDLLILKWLPFWFNSESSCLALQYHPSMSMIHNINWRKHLLITPYFFALFVLILPNRKSLLPWRLGSTQRTLLYLQGGSTVVAWSGRELPGTSRWRPFDHHQTRRRKWICGVRSAGYICGNRIWNMVDWIKTTRGKKTYCLYKIMLILYLTVRYPKCSIIRWSTSNWKPKHFTVFSTPHNFGFLA